MTASNFYGLNVLHYTYTMGLRGKYIIILHLTLMTKELAEIRGDDSFFFLDALFKFGGWIVYDWKGSKFGIVVFVK